MARPKKKPRATTPIDKPMQPTPERMAKAGEFYVVGGDGRVTMRDGMIDRIRKRGVITERQAEAGRRYRLYWYHAGLEPGPNGVDPNRIYAPDHTGMRLMAQSERQAEYRQRYRQAARHIGLRMSRLMEHIACEDATLEEAGRKILGWGNKAQAIAAATEMFRDATDRLADLWGFPHWIDDEEAEEIA